VWLLWRDWLSISSRLEHGISNNGDGGGQLLLPAFLILLYFRFFFFSPLLFDFCSRAVCFCGAVCGEVSEVEWRFATTPQYWRFGTASGSPCD
jgi:hypothetical protein